MRVFAIAADVIMGIILGVFLYAALSRTWPAAAHPVVAVLIMAASVLVVLVRRPNGSLAWRPDRR
jgi:hypothetical protein